MRNKRSVSSEMVHAWVDGEAGERAKDVAALVANDPALTAEADRVRNTGAALRSMVDDGMGPVDPLIAVIRIRQLIAHHKERTFLGKLASWWSDVTTFNRRAFAGVAVAMALGAVSAPLVVYVMGRSSFEPAVLSTAAADTTSYVPASDTAVMLTVRLVSANDRDSVIDTGLRRIAAELTRPGATGYTLVGESTLGVEPGSASQVDLPDGGTAVLRSRGTSLGVLQLDVDIDVSDVHTTVNLAPGTTRTIDGPTHDGEALVIAITRE
ncbi:MAG: hypothetical protein H7Z43_01195 [Clostridia bacterium]|nr:hypothetical protein [Deltaproteobacteria bacterium]